MINGDNPMLSLHGLLLWNKHFPLDQFPNVTTENSYIQKMIMRKKDFFFSHIMNILYSLNIPQKFLYMISADNKITIAIKESTQGFFDNRKINPSISLMNLDLLHNILFDIIANDRGYTYTVGDYGSNLEQMKNDFPLTYNSFKIVHEKRNQNTDAHYKDKNGNPRVRITGREYEILLNIASLHEAYNEIFQYYNDEKP